ncbi:alpha-D-ribose 1-methylphosphonate 5-triphosphate diphosphatase [Pandoraea nosoerga]|uniref:Phosphonate metabolism protein PhnM n=1 Tax=Pandoraea nosoerga TaxID=2508296 RepID=A0A5E4RNB1_9BURK|nr:alpha-D-ribose 1-methylphosphonate 5-triphosphate diphosphatase [Pandoraea nosoerga]MBN4664536.1 alpha-D-ribose 1-methylphosphonate 5-triphosphate diphosphatase [Pandoraea nosoerga]MBN4674428.1 alpha-D-ribose 1-methylphosphonate 5-triphosphate diphosphatase [Pandoraea nosoerga]MBN4679696.1 alpha-D-ribose 1-methylphosphonate 5-triphosphate diphosphatase [Pandoraea nosoerga]MBN4743215.1 alpha-D-ribose 1-methylphosphonate 5-triphosphate diphosphatase [Pandoraea nosoerga]VVD64475.1 phosphonate 
MLIKNAHIVTPQTTFTGVVEVREGRIRSVEEGTTQVPDAVDWEGDHLLPGLVELHTDNLEKHLAPRPGVLWNTHAAFAIHDAQVAAAGITTVFDSLVIGERDASGLRSRRVQDECGQALLETAAAGLFRADHFLHLRCEVATRDAADAFVEMCDHPLLRLVSVMDHTPGQRQWHDPALYRQYHERNGKVSDETWEKMLGELKAQQAAFAGPHRRRIVEMSRARGLPLASHDDTSLEHVEEAVRDGVTLSEFPTTLAAARSAHARAIGVIMGAPNVVRGGSHSGNVAAADLAREGVLDILSSDYVPPSLLQAAFALHTDIGWSLSKAMRTVSWNPARSAGLADRGGIVPGLRADLVRVTVRPGMPPVPRATYVLGARVA